jgi:hypothetical protein
MGTLGAIKNESVLSRELRRRRRPLVGSLAFARARNTSSSCTFAVLQRSIHGELLSSPPGFTSPASRAGRRRSIRTSGRAALGLSCRKRRPGPLPQEEETYRRASRPPSSRETPRTVVLERRKAQSFPPLCRCRSSNEGACFGATSFGSAAASAVGRRRQPEPAASTATPASSSSQEVAFARAFGGGELRTIASPTLVVA